MFRTHPVWQLVWCVQNLIHLPSVHTLHVFKCLIVWLIHNFYNILENSHILSTCNLLLAVECSEAYEIHRCNPFYCKWPSLVCTPWQETCRNEVTIMSNIARTGTMNENVELQVVFNTWVPTHPPTKLLMSAELELQSLEHFNNPLWWQEEEVEVC